MKKSGVIVLVVVVLLALVGGGYALFHKSDTKKPSTSSADTPKPVARATVNNTVVVTKTDATIGKYLTDPSGKTLYIFLNDTSGVSTCTDECLKSWPAYTDTGASTGLPANVGVITRTDNGQKQFTYNGHPLYYFAGAETGLSGNGMNSFAVALPVSAAVAADPNAPAGNAAYPY